MEHALDGDATNDSHATRKVGQAMRLEQVEQELKKRWKYQYTWGQSQNNYFDRLTDFIYKTETFAGLLSEIDRRFRDNPDHQRLFNYALNRWYNFWSAQALEEVFRSCPGVVPEPDAMNRLVDFTLRGIPFDHKSTKFPDGFGQDIVYALGHPRELIEWLYLNQSQERRKHLRNRLFVVLHSGGIPHWRLKAEIQWLKGIVESYVSTFDASKLHRFAFEPNSPTLSDIIWAIQYLP